LVTKILERWYPYDITNWVIAADDKHPVIVALGSCTPNTLCAVPNHLSIMQALIVNTLVVLVIIVGLLRHPHFHWIHASQFFITLRQVLPMRPIRMLKFARFFLRVHIFLSIFYKGFVPFQWFNTNLLTSFVVCIKEIFGGALGEANAAHWDNGQDEHKIWGLHCFLIVLILRDFDRALNICCYKGRHALCNINHDVWT